MPTTQLVGIVINVLIYVALIVFVVYRQMSAQPLRPQRLVLLPAVLAVFGVQQLVSEHAVSAGTVVYLAINAVAGVTLGVWRGTTFRVWSRGGAIMMQGTRLTLASWGLLILIRVAFALVIHATTYGQGVVIGELLVALAVTFAAQNSVIWARSAKLGATLMGRGTPTYAGFQNPDESLAGPWLEESRRAERPR